MNNLARVCWISAPVYVLVGMGFGIWMAVADQRIYSAAHAHLNLLGWVTIGLFGTFYTVMPRAAEWTLSKIQVGLAQLGTILMFPGIILEVAGMDDKLVSAGSVFAILAMILFLVVVIRATRSA